MPKSNVKCLVPAIPISDIRQSQLKPGTSLYRVGTFLPRSTVISCSERTLKPKRNVVLSAYNVKNTNLLRSGAINVGAR